MQLASIKIGFFAAIVFAPALALIAGPVDPCGGPHPTFPEVVDIVSLRPAALDEFSTAALHRSAVSKAAVTTRNWFSYRVFSYVNTPKVISGRENWLFYKSEFFGGRCQSAKRLALAARSVDALVELADAVGISLHVSLSPDKSVIYPEMLAPSMRVLWECKAENAALLRDALRAYAPRVIDHSEVLQGEKAAHPGRPLYFRTDTHWTPYGGAFALRQLVAAVRADDAVLPPPRLLTGSDLRKTDLRSGMLMLPMRERYRPIDHEVEERALATERSAEGTVVLHDSFYATLSHDLALAFPGAQFFHIDSVGELAAEIGAAQTLIVNSVERLFTLRATNDILGTSGGLARALWERNTALAAGCTGFDDDSDAVVPEAILRSADDLSATPTELRPDGADPRIVLEIPASTPGERACLRLELESADGGQVELFLPSPRHRAARFEAGRAFNLPLKAGVQTLVMLLPPAAAGRAVRIDLGDAPAPQATLRRARVGRLPGLATAL